MITRKKPRQSIRSRWRPWLLSTSQRLLSYRICDLYQELLYYANTATAKCGELLMKAINYAKAEWKGLIKYTEDGKYRVDNNAAESIMRDLACGRKNFLFCGSDHAAKNLAFAYSLTESCKLNNINPYDYWSDLIDFIGCELLEQRRHTKAGFQFAES